MASAAVHTSHIWLHTPQRSRGKYLLRWEVDRPSWNSYTTLHFYTALYYITPYTALHYTIPYTLHYTIHCTKLHHATLHYSTLHHTVHYIVHYTTPNYTSLYYTTVGYSAGDITWDPQGRGMTVWRGRYLVPPSKQYQKFWNSEKNRIKYFFLFNWGKYWLSSQVSWDRGGLRVLLGGICPGGLPPPLMAWLVGGGGLLLGYGGSCRVTHTHTHTSLSF